MTDDDKLDERDLIDLDTIDELVKTAASLSSPIEPAKCLCPECDREWKAYVLIHDKGTRVQAGRFRGTHYLTYEKLERLPGYPPLIAVCDECKERANNEEATDADSET